MAGAAWEIQATIDQLVQERQALRAAGAPRPELDANRHALAYWQLALTQLMAREGLARRPAA
jgi:hypothetical protein